MIVWVEVVRSGVWEDGVKVHGSAVTKIADLRERIRLLCWLFYWQVSKNYWMEIPTHVSWVGISEIGDTFSNKVKKTMFCYFAKDALKFEIFHFGSPSLILLSKLSLKFEVFILKCTVHPLSLASFDFVL